MTISETKSSNTESNSEHQANVEEYNDDTINQIEISHPDTTPKDVWKFQHIAKIIIGAGIGSLLEYYSFALVAYFETELKTAYFPPISSDYISLMEEFALYGIGIILITDYMYTIHSLSAK